MTSLLMTCVLLALCMLPAIAAPHDGYLPGRKPHAWYKAERAERREVRRERRQARRDWRRYERPRLEERRALRRDWERR